VQVNFECSVEDLSDMIMVTFKSDNELRNYLDLIEKRSKSREPVNEWSPEGH